MGTDIVQIMFTSDDEYGQGGGGVWGGGVGGGALNTSLKTQDKALIVYCIKMVYLVDAGTGLS